ncbi:ArsR/SmtB family transcription factor [Nocardioides lacusdianchii]|uniref:ArsR/SmtB family transcription factor n=1 Tax=Nocardioides lacusdianchii TaxID=2783664 RepID=UPI001CCFA3F2|nr:metalloregulator ArsR/SmtB family transcription factor [Nocardioides lacusdianchii]
MDQHHPHSRTGVGYFSVVNDEELVRARGDEPDQITGGGRHQHPVDPRRVAMARERLPSAEEGDRLTSVLSLMADPTRARLLYALDVVDELCVGDLALALSVSEDAVSYGLRVLRTAGLVTRRKEGRIVFYRLAEGFPEPLRQHCLRQLIEMSRAPIDDEP